MDPLVLVQSAVITLFTGIIAGVAPALYETRRLQAKLKIDPAALLRA